MQARNEMFGLGIICAAIWIFAVSLSAANSAAIQDILKLKDAGVQDETIVAFIQSKNINYDLSADDLLSLRTKGLSEAVLKAMLASGKPTGSTASTGGTRASPTAGGSTPQGAPQAPSVQPPPQPAASGPSSPPVSVPPPPPSVLPPAQPAPRADPDVAFFYDALTPYGRWILIEDGRWCWQPAVVVATPGWRPYWDSGYWVWTDYGWYWYSEYPWGWAVFHYGRWHLHPRHGWVWVPDRVWGPAWVVWRTGGEYCGWAPLPPGVVYDTVSARFVYHGKHVSAGFDFGLDWVHFSFCYVADIGKPSRRPIGGDRGRDVFQHTTVVFNYTVDRPHGGGHEGHRIINHGIDPAHVGGGGKPLPMVQVRAVDSPQPPRVYERIDPRRKTISVYRPPHGGHGPR
ncbi:MAG: DUF6600 domain-containing protein [Verrucomicrobiia bacterium]